MHLRASAKVVLPLIECSKRSLSDHASVRISLNAKKLLPKEMRPIPKWIAKHPIYKSVLVDLEKRANLDDFPPYDRWCKHKQIIREASETTARRYLNRVVHTNADSFKS